jgi:two-component system, NarL family, nitrate/nitrite response regulator NarL
MPGSVLVIEDHPLFRGGLASLVQTIFADLLVAETSSAEAALRVGADLANLRLILLDFRLPGLHGAEAVRLLHARFPKAHVVVLTASEDRREAAAAMRAGAKAFLSKSMTMEELGESLGQVLAGAELAPRWSNSVPAQADDGSGSDLTPRQLQILALLCQGHSNKEIGLRLGLAVVTVKMHVSSIFRSLRVVNRTQAVLAARGIGLTGVADAQAAHATDARNSVRPTTAP